MNPSGSEFTLRVAICDLVERLKRMQHKCSYLEECRNQLVKEVIRLRIQNEWLAKQMHDTPGVVGVSTSSSSLPSPPHGNMNNSSVSQSPAGHQGQSASQCFCNVSSQTGTGVVQHHHSSLVNSSLTPNLLQHQPNCPFVLASTSASNEQAVLTTAATDASSAAPSAPAAGLFTGDSFDTGAEYFMNGDNSEHVNANQSSATHSRPNNSTSGIAHNNTISDESLHLMNILNQFEQEDNNASKENSIKNLTLQMLRELENEMRTGKLKGDLLKLINSGPTKCLPVSSDGLPYEETLEDSKHSRQLGYSFNNNNGGDKSLESLEDSGAFDPTKVTGVTGKNIFDHIHGDCIDLTELLDEDELMSLVSLIRKEIKSVYQEIHASTERLSKIKQKNEDDKFRHYFQKQIKSESATNQSTNQSISGQNVGPISVSISTGIGNLSHSTGNTILAERNGSGSNFPGNILKTNLKHS